MTTANALLKVVGVAVVSILAVACEESREGGTEVEEPAAAQEAEAEAPVAAPLLQLERILRRVERGDADASDATALKALVAAGELPTASLDQASLALSTVLEDEGDGEGAIRAIEDLMRRHSGDPRFEAHDAAERRLRLLLTGTEEAPANAARNMEPTAEVARALVKHFPEDDRGVTLFDVVSVGRATTSDPHGIWNLSGAKRALAEAECSVCDVDVRVARSHSRLGSWIDLPLHAGEQRPDMPNPDRSMVVVYFDLVQNRVPARYDAYLALPSAEVVARLERGEAFVAARERPGKKPLLLLAAPRAGQLDAVEAAFAELRALPTEPHPVEVSRKLLPPEIQGVVRGDFRKFRTCYESLLKSDPAAAGKVTLKFRIDGEGKTREVTTESSFADAGIGRCVGDAAAAMTFPATGETVTVSYPIAFSP